MDAMVQTYKRMNQILGSANNKKEESGVLQNVSRRGFLKLTGGIAGAGILLSACHKTPPDTIYIGSGDTALLNYLYMMETVMAAFYTRSNAIGPQYYGLTTSELQLLADLRDHQLAHKELLVKLLGTAAIPEIVTDLSPVTFSDRTNTLNHTIMFEDLAVGAYTGAAKRFKDTTYVPLLAKMATVQARHSAYARDILAANTFSDSTIVNSNGMDQALSPVTVMTALQPYIQTHLDMTNLPA